jgi:spermidine synthase
MTVVAIPKPEALVSSRALPVLVGVLFFLSGFSALTYQIAWQRMLGLFSGSDSIAVTIIVGSFLLGLGIGSLVASAIADRLSTRGAILGFAVCEFGVGLFAIASKLFFYDLLFKRMVAFSDSAAFVFFASFLGLLVPTFLMGLSLPLLAKALVRQIETAAAQIGWLYGVNTLGAYAGAFLSGCVIIGTIGYVPTILLAAGLNLWWRCCRCCWRYSGMITAAPRRRPSLRRMRPRSIRPRMDGCGSGPRSSSCPGLR